MHNSASVLENETNKLPLVFNIETHHLIFIIINNNNNNKKSFKIVDFAVPTDPRLKFKGNENKKIIYPILLGN